VDLGVKVVERLPASVTEYDDSEPGVTASISPIDDVA